MTTRVRCVSMRFWLIPLRALETTHLRVRKVSSTLSLTGHLFTGHPSSWYTLETAHLRVPCVLSSTLSRLVFISPQSLEELFRDRFTFLYEAFWDTSVHETLISTVLSWKSEQGPDVSSVQRRCPNYYMRNKRALPQVGNKVGAGLFTIEWEFIWFTIVIIHYCDNSLCNGKSPSHFPSRGSRNFTTLQTWTVRTR